MGNWVFGCDVCQEVCPFQRFAPPTRERAFLPVDPDRAAPPLVDLLSMTESAFELRFGASPLARVKRERLIRNACVAAGNSADPVLISPLRALLDDPSPLIRTHAEWAISRFG